MPKQIPLEIAEALISAIQKREVLYNTRFPSYKNRHFTDNAWKDVADEVQREVHHCKAMWTTLRGTFNKVLAAMKLPSGSGTSAKPPKWYLFEQTLFLKDHVSHGHMTGNLHLTQKNTTESPGPIPVELVADNAALPAQAVPQNGVNGGQPPVFEPATPSRGPSFPTFPAASTSNSKHKRKASERDPVEDEFLTLLKARGVSFNRTDEVITYLKSLAPFINRLSSAKQYKFMATTTNTLMAMLNEEN